MKKRRLQTTTRARRLAPFACLCLLIPLAGCRGGRTPTATNDSAANANAATQAQPSAGATTCGVPYYPVRAGLEKQYRVTYDRGESQPAVYTESYADIGPDSFKLRYRFAELTVDTGWNCSPEGMVALEYGKLEFARRGDDFKMETAGRTGVTVPAAARWREGEEWRSGYEIRTELAGGQGVVGRGSGTIEITNRVTGRERVTVPAGSFDTLKVESTMTMRLTVRVGQMSTPTNTTFRNTSWFAENVGMVRAVSAGDMAGATTELVGLKQ